MKLDPLVTQIIVATNFDHFTTADVRSLYLPLKNDDSLDRCVVRRRGLLVSVKLGYLTLLRYNLKIVTYLKNLLVMQKIRNSNY